MQIRETIGVSLSGPVEGRLLEDVVVLADRAGVALGVQHAFSARVRDVRDGGSGLIASRYAEIPLVGPNGEVSGILCRASVPSDARGVATPRRRDIASIMPDVAQFLVHNIDNLLAVIDSGLRLLECQTDAARRKAILAKMQQAIARGAMSSRQFLDAEQAGAESIDGFVTGTRLATIASALDWTLPLHITVRAEIAPDLWAFNADPEELYFALLDLCQVSADAMPRGGTITVKAHNVEPSADASGEFVEIVAADDGDGMPERILSQALTSDFTTRATGHGTGLSQVRRFAEERGGVVCTESKRGAGTRMRLLLPRAHRAGLPSTIVGTEIAYTPSPNGGMFHVGESRDSFGAILASANTWRPVQRGSS
ncbi:MULTISPECIES: ATP-binding protein [Bradyrhizobium]|uniref:ATP-binding protein n=1 Tax=Bradyrhizobium TaxID=374 RepID=UPI00271557D4|nr:ATP-binding protein [Bradyrhizobium elkanii]WLA49682.1 ATP-binding protein [Bradyrhizobium elkanii]WLB80082.1 ATP-binding protein [Bradyrhizobium elkanii]